MVRRVDCPLGCTIAVVIVCVLTFAIARADDPFTLAGDGADQAAAAAAQAAESKADSAADSSGPATVPTTVPTTIAATTTSVSSSSVGTSVPPIGAPIGAVVLFDGEDTNGWTSLDGKPCPWKLEDETMVAGGGNVISKELFEDVQLHVEFWLPKHPPEVKGQARGNSGVYLQGRYEIQVLDTYGLPPDKHGCGAIYGKKKPKENTCTPPETWQSYDIKYTAARFDAAGKKTKNARVSVIHNGVTIHDDVEIDGPTTAGMGKETPGPAPIMLQDHGNPVRFRNIYAIRVKPGKATMPTSRPTVVRPEL